jgi:serine/threonine protein phosphatase PrpC
MNFRLTEALVAGEAHRGLWRNNQDALKVIRERDFIAGVVCDGCGSSPESEVGARITARYTANFCRKNFPRGAFSESMLREGIYELYRMMAREIAPDDTAHFIEETLMCTIVGFLITPALTTVFSSGDGVWCVNYEWKEIDQNNHPEFLAYKLSRGIDFPFSVKQYETDAVERILVSTDGLQNYFITTTTGSV